MNGNITAIIALASLVLIACGGCGEATERNGAHVETVRMLERMDETLRMSGNDAWDWGREVSRRIGGVQEAESKKRLTSLFVERLRRIEPLSDARTRWPIVLRNYASVLYAFETFVENEEDAEVYLGLVARIQGFYRQAIVDCASAFAGRAEAHGNSADVRRVLGELETGFSELQGMVEKVCLPLVSARYLPIDRHAYWEERLMSKSRRLKEDGRVGE